MLVSVDLLFTQKSASSLCLYILKFAEIWAKKGGGGWIFYNGELICEENGTFYIFSINLICNIHYACYWRRNV